jgi:hypothetical protein
MPKEVKEEYKFSAPPKTYKWDTWFDGKTRVFQQGEDFHCTMDSFRKMAYIAARGRGLKVRSQMDNAKGTFVMCAIPDPTKTKTRKKGNTNASGSNE